MIEVMKFAAVCFLLALIFGFFSFKWNSFGSGKGSVLSAISIVPFGIFAGSFLICVLFFIGNWAFS